MDMHNKAVLRAYSMSCAGPVRDWLRKHCHHNDGLGKICMFIEELSGNNESPQRKPFKAQAERPLSEVTNYISRPRKARRRPRPVPGPLTVLSVCTWHLHPISRPGFSPSD
jgi:hypothetical protein